MRRCRHWVRDDWRRPSTGSREASFKGAKYGVAWSWFLTAAMNARLIRKDQLTGRNPLRELSPLQVFQLSPKICPDKFISWSHPRARTATYLLAAVVKDAEERGQSLEQWLLEAIAELDLGAQQHDPVAVDMISQCLRPQGGIAA